MWGDLIIGVHVGSAAPTALMPAALIGPTMRDGLLYSTAAAAHETADYHPP